MLSVMLRESRARIGTNMTVSVHSTVAPVRAYNPAHTSFLLQMVYKHPPFTNLQSTNHVRHQRDQHDRSDDHLDGLGHVRAGASVDAGGSRGYF